MESPVDIDNAPEPAFADGPSPSGEPIASPPRVRWRQRAVGRGRALPAGAPAASRAPIAPPRPTRHATPNAGAHVVEQGTSGVPPEAADASANSCGRDDPQPPRHARDALRTASDSTPPEMTVPPKTADARHTIDAMSIEQPTSIRDFADGDDPAPRAEHGAGACADPGTDSPVETDDAAMAASADPQRAPRDIELWLLARRAQGAALRLDFELRTAPARQVFRRDFVYVSRQLHALEGSRRVQGLDRARLDEALTALRQRADTIQAFLGQRAVELQSAIAARGPASAHIAFTRPARFQATIVSPAAHRFLALVMKVDDTLAVLETAWLLGLVEPATRSALVSDCRRALLGFKDLACDLRRAVGLLVQDINAQRREGLAAAPDA